MCVPTVKLGFNGVPYVGGWIVNPNRRGAASQQPDLHVGLVDTPGWPGWSGKPVPAALEFRSIMVDPAHNGGVRQRQATLRHHFHQVAVAQFEAQIPSHAQDDDLPVKVAALEQLIQTQEPGHRIAFSLSERPNMGGLRICTRARPRRHSAATSGWTWSYERWPAKFGQVDKWKFCLRAARMPRIRSDHDETSTPDTCTGFQGQGGAGRHQGREDAGRAGPAV